MVIFGADHIYRMNIREMIEFHMHKRAQATIAAIPVHKDLAGEFGVIEAAPDGAVVGFHEKRADAPTMPGDPERVFASMGNYIFSTNLLLQELYADAENEYSSHDFGRDILPSLVGRAPMFAYDFQTNRIPGDPAEQDPYWRDVGTIDAYLRRQHGSARGHAGAESVQSPVAAAHRELFGSRRRNSFSISKGGAARPSIRLSPAARFYPAAWCGVR